MPPHVGSNPPGGDGLAAGTVLEGKYEIIRRLGVGGMGVVYEAIHQHLRKRVAIKTLTPELAQREDLIARVVREARLASSTGHPNIVMVTDLGWVEGAPFFVMELLDGETITDALERDGPIPVRDAADIICQVLDGLAAVHELGIVHRDLKPSNVMLTRDRHGHRVVKLVDFGISKIAESGDRPNEPVLTLPGSVLGSPRHIAPEQVLAEVDIDLRADIHGAGALLYTMLVGRSPFTGPTAAVAMVRVLEGTYDPPTTLVPGLPGALEVIMTRAMAVDRAHRYASADEMRQALLPFAGLAPGTTSPGPTTLAAGPRPAHVVVPVAADGLPVDNLPPLAALTGTEVATSPAWPTASAPSKAVISGGPRTPAAQPNAPASLTLDVPEGWQAGDLDVAHDRARAPSKGAVPWAALAVVGVLGVGGWAAWTYRSDIAETSNSGAPSSKRRGKPGEVVLLMVDTTPKNAVIFVDDVQHAERPLSLPKTGEYVKLRIEAPGFTTRTLQVQAKTSRRLKVKLSRVR